MRTDERDLLIDLRRALRLGGAAVLALALTAALTYGANRRQENAVLHVHRRGRLSRDAYLVVLERADLARRQLTAPKEEAKVTDDSLRALTASMLDSLADESASLPNEFVRVQSLRGEVAKWDTTFVQAVFAEHGTSILPRVLLAAADQLFEAVERDFTALQVIQDAAYVAALRHDDGLRFISAGSLLLELALMSGGFLSLRQRLIANAKRLSLTQEEVLDRMAATAAYRDNSAGRHVQRVAKLSARLAQAAGLSEGSVESIRRAARLHDIGKIGIPDHILFKTEDLDASEAAIMRTHVSIGAGLLKGGESDLIRTAEAIARYHHEHWDGTGFPDGLSGDAIPIAARIVAVADTFDALRGESPQHTALSLRGALDALKRVRGTRLDPQLVDLFIDRHCYGEHATAWRGA